MKNKSLLLTVLALLPCTGRADHADFVTVNATATKGYTQNKFADGSPKPESYVFYQGKYFAGTPDRSIDRTTFRDIVQVLAPDLARQNYLPTKNAKAADLLIVVNWGTTIMEPGSEQSDPEKQLQFDTLSKSIGTYNTAFDAYQNGAGTPRPDPSDITFNMMIAEGDEISAQTYAGFNARLLGYSNIVNKEESQSWAYPDGLSPKAESHLADLTQERYFVVLLAYDYQKMQHAAPAKGGHAPQPQPLWSVRMNIRADGNNFTQALPAMSQVASEYFGKQSNDLVTAQAAVGSKADVQIGETKVLKEGK